MTALLAIALFVSLVVVHEFGHFVVAKLTRVRVEEFGIGYPPRAFLLGKWGGTEYTINWLPLGGFVRLFGDEETGAHGRGSMQDAPRVVQAAILVAGVTMNAVFAWVLFAWALTIGVPSVVEEALPGEHAQLFISDIVPTSPASVAGLSVGDEIILIKDPQGAGPQRLSPVAVSEFVRARGGQALAITYVHAGATSTTTVRPANAVVPGAANKPGIGVGLALVATHALPLHKAAYVSVFVTYDYFKATFIGMAQVIREAFSGSPDLSNIVGPVGLATIVGDAAHNGIGNVIKLAGFISVNLAVINLIPIPVLDGGRLVLLGVEAVMRRRAPRLFVQSLNAIGVALIILLMVVVTYHDVARLLA